MARWWAYIGDPDRQIWIMQGDQAPFDYPYNGILVRAELVIESNNAPYQDFIDYFKDKGYVLIVDEFAQTGHWITPEEEAERNPKLPPGNRFTRLTV